MRVGKKRLIIWLLISCTVIASIPRADEIPIYVLRLKTNFYAIHRGIDLQSSPYALAIVLVLLNSISTKTE